MGLNSCVPKEEPLGTSRASRESQAAFTLVEVLVVIGIIAVLIGILLPVINKSRQASITIKCQAQLRQLYHGLSMYAVDNKGRLPWGQYRVASDYVGAYRSAMPMGLQNVVTWQTIINQYFNPKALNTLFDPATGQITIGINPADNLFLCPGVGMGSARSSYACNLVAMPDKDYEEAYTDTSKQPLLQPALFAKLFPHNILLFDTNAMLNSDTMYATGFDVDYQYFIDPGDTEARFFRGDDPYNGNKFRGSALPVITEANQNQDFGDASTTNPPYPYQGNIRYRHNGDRVGNFVFADGHVDSLRPDQVIRYMFKLRWPSGMPVSTGSWEDPD